MLRIGLLLLVLFSVLNTPCWAASSPTAPHYVEDALVNGQLVQRWNDQTDVIYVTIKSGSHLKNWNGLYVEEVKKAFSTWQTLLGNRFRFVYTNDPKLSDITVEWWQQAKGAEVGLQTLKWSNNTITEATINIALWNPAGGVFNNTQIYGIALHEIGHVLGIRGHSNNPNDIMYYSMDKTTPTLSTRDMNTMRMLYQRKPDISNPIGVHLMQYRYYEYYAKLGAQALMQNNPTKAVQYFTQAKQYYQHDHRLSLLLGLSAYGLANYETAVSTLKPALKMEMNSEELATCEFFLAQAYLQLAKKAYQQGNQSNALTQLTQAKYHFDRVAKNPNLPPEFKSTAVKNNNILKNSGLSFSSLKAKRPFTQSAAR